MSAVTNRHLSLLRQIEEGRGPVAEVRLDSTSWWIGDVSFTREMNAMRKSGLIRMWRTAARDQKLEITEAGHQALRDFRKSTR